MTRLSWQPNTISQGWSTWSRLIKITIRFTLSITQTWLILIIWSVEKRASEMLDCAANVSFCRSAGEARRTATSNVLLQRLSFHFCLLGCLFISFPSAWGKIDVYFLSQLPPSLFLLSPSFLTTELILLIYMQPSGRTERGILDSLHSYGKWGAHRSRGGSHIRVQFAAVLKYGSSKTGWSVIQKRETILRVSFFLCMCADFFFCTWQRQRSNSRAIPKVQYIHTTEAFKHASKLICLIIALCPSLHFLINITACVKNHTTGERSSCPVDFA